MKTNTLEKELKLKGYKETEESSDINKIYLKEDSLIEFLNKNGETRSFFYISLKEKERIEKEEMHVSIENYILYPCNKYFLTQI